MSTWLLIKGQQDVKKVSCQLTSKLCKATSLGKILIMTEVHIHTMQQVVHHLAAC